MFLNRFRNRSTYAVSCRRSCRVVVLRTFPNAFIDNMFVRLQTRTTRGSSYTWKTSTTNLRTSSTGRCRCKPSCSWTRRRTRPFSRCKPETRTPITAYITSSSGTEVRRIRTARIPKKIHKIKNSHLGSPKVIPLILYVLRIFFFFFRNHLTSHKV